MHEHHETHHHEHNKHDAHAGHSSHHDHDKHAGHSPNMFKQKFWVSLLLTVPALVFSSSVQSWLHYQITFSGSQYIPALFGIILFWYGGLVFLKSARAELQNRQPGMMTLISMAITVALGYSLAITTHLLQGMDFWWELATLITIMLLGHWLEMASVQNAQGALDELAKLLPDQAELITGGNVKTVAVSELVVGDVVLVRPGGQLPVDGQVVKGESDVNESMLTGESKPVKKQVKSEVVAGTINGTGSLTVKVTKTGNNTTLAGIMKLVAEAQSSKSKTQVLADKAAFYLTFVAIGAALATAVGWAVFSDRSATFILARVVTVLVIACPHALGLAIPLVTAISTTLAAKNGLLVRQRLALEAARNVNVVLFDKTGTLTKGQQSVADIWPAHDFTTDQVLQLTASIEQDSEHLIGKSITEFARRQKVPLTSVTSFKALPGFGVMSTIKGQQYIVASRAYVANRGIEVPAKLNKRIAQAARDGKTEVYLLQDDYVVGVLTLADEIRPESYETITTLKSMGIKTAMITGDSQQVAEYVAKKLGIDEFYAEVQPSEKANHVKALQAPGYKVAMVGDGVNDAPALTQSDVGIAIGAGTDIAIESAGIVLAGDDPRGVIKIVKLSRATYTKMVQNLAWAVGYNALALPLAAGITAALGFVLSPAIGAVLMSISTIVVAVNAQFLRKLKL